MIDSSGRAIGGPVQGNRLTAAPHKVRFRWRTGVIFAVCLAMSLPGAITRRGAAHAQVLQDYHHTAWTSESGIGAVFDIQQASDGYLWLTTSKGIFRFDGVRFQSIEEVTQGTVRTNDVDDLYLAHSGGVWLSTRNAGLLFWMDGRLTTYTDRRCTPALHMIGIAEDRDGALWILASGGVFRMHGLNCDHMGAQYGYPVAIFVDHRGTFRWENNSGEILFLPRGQSKFEISKYKADPSVGYVFFHEAPNGSIWLSDDYGLRCVTDETGVPLSSFPLHNGKKIAGFGDFALGSDGSLWAVIGQGGRNSNCTW